MDERTKATKKKMKIYCQEFSRDNLAETVRLNNRAQDHGPNIVQKFKMVRNTKQNRLYFIHMFCISIIAVTAMSSC